MNNFLPIDNKKIGILGAAKSGLAAAELAHEYGAKVFISDNRKLSNINIKDFEYELGKHSDRILKSDFIIKSPGIKNDIEIIKKINDLSIPLISEIEFASWFTKSFIIAITGTNGKTTTIELLHSVLKRNGINSYKGGNIGTPFSSNVLKEKNKSSKDKIFHVIELSSFQLDDIIFFKPNISILLNISPDHLDYHINFKKYLNAKLKITMNQDTDCYAIFNERDIDCLHQTSNAKKINFNVSRSGNMYAKSEKIKLEIKNSLLKGLHNYENILSVFLASKLCGLDKHVILKSINLFNPLPHRMEKIKIKCSINFFNDSKATNLHATCAAIDTFENKVILILGGIDKNNSSFNDLNKYNDKINKIVLYGKSRYSIKRELQNHFDIYDYEKFEDAIVKSIKIAKPKDNILLSPACSSFDQFKSYEERGNCFKKIIMRNYDKN